VLSWFFEKLGLIFILLILLIGIICILVGVDLLPAELPIASQCRVCLKVITIVIYIIDLLFSRFNTAYTIPALWSHDLMVDSFKELQNVMDVLDATPNNSFAGDVREINTAQFFQIAYKSLNSLGSASMRLTQFEEFIACGGKENLT
jgi:phosphoglycerol transferase MdoB-like AlkP superfamily enzyme